MSRSTARKNCVVIGGSGSLGRVICRSLASQNARVAFTYHRGESVAEELASELPGGMSLRLDVASVGAIEQVLDVVSDEFGSIDALVHCAALAVTESSGDTESSAPSVADIEEVAWNQVMTVNVTSAFFACRKVVEIMRRGDGGSIVLIGSVDNAKLMPSPIHYAASKGALHGMARALAKEVGEYGIQVNLVAPGVLEGGLSGVLPKSLHEQYTKHCAMGRVGRFSEIAPMVSWLALNRTYLTGQTIVLDGGL